VSLQLPRTTMYCESFGAYSANPSCFTAFHTSNHIKMTTNTTRCSRSRYSRNSTVNVTRGPNERFITQLTEGWNAQSAAVFIDGEKQTTDLAKELRYLMGKAKARQFYADEKIMDVSIFDSVAWEDLRSLLQGRPKMYQLWFGKQCQCSGFCGTGDKLSQWDRTESNKCPNCGSFEKADHLNKCSSKIRRGLLTDSLYDLLEWMEENCTHPELLLWIPLYLQKQGYKLFVDPSTRMGGRCHSR
jgi:hypothetical protein